MLTTFLIKGKSTAIITTDASGVTVAQVDIHCEENPSGVVSTQIPIVLDERMREFLFPNGGLEEFNISAEIVFERKE